MDTNDSMVLTILRWAEDKGLQGVTVMLAEDLAKQLLAVGPARQPWTRWTDAMREELRERHARGEKLTRLGKGDLWSAGPVLITEACECGHGRALHDRQGCRGHHVRDLPASDGGGTEWLECTCVQFVELQP